MFKEESKTKSSESVMESSAAQTGSSVSLISDDSSGSSPRKLSLHDSQLLTKHIANPTKPNAALKAAARKYW